MSNTSHITVRKQHSTVTRKILKFNIGTSRYDGDSNGIEDLI